MPRILDAIGSPDLGAHEWFAGRPATPWRRELARWGFYALWLLPAGGVGVIEVRASRCPRRSAFAVALFWLSAVAAYCAYWAATLLLGFGGPQLQVRLDQGWATWWQDVLLLRGVLKGVLRDFVFWGTTAVVGGVVVGWLVGLVGVRVFPRRQRRATPTK
jgi:hypothetical protein